MKFGPLRIVVLYVVTGILWITLSDKLLFLFDDVLDHHGLAVVSNIKGIAFVVLTGFLLYQLIKRHTASLSSSERKYRSYFNDNPGPMWIYDRNTLAFIAVNDAAVAHYGYSREEFLSMTILDIRPAEDAALLRAKILETDTSYRNSGVWRHFKKDGSLISAEVTSHVFATDEGDQVMVMAIDTTERMLFEEQVKTANEELRLLNDHLSAQKRLLVKIERISRLGGWEYYLDNDHLIRSQGIYEIFDFVVEREKDPLKNLAQHVHPDDASAFREDIRLLETEAKSIDSTYRLVNRHDGSIRYLRQIAFAEKSDERVFRINGSMQDVTEMKMLEGERNNYLRQLEDTIDVLERTGEENRRNVASLKRQNELLLEIAWLESHEVRRPLASILGLISLIRVAVDKNEQLELIELIDFSAQELDVMVRKINTKISDVAL